MALKILHSGVRALVIADYGESVRGGSPMEDLDDATRRHHQTIREIRAVRNWVVFGLFCFLLALLR